MMTLYIGTQPIEMVVHQTDRLEFSVEETTIVENDEWVPTKQYELHATITITKEEVKRICAYFGFRPYRHKKGTSVSKPPYFERLHPRKDTHKKSYWLRIRSNPYRRNYH